MKPLKALVKAGWLPPPEPLDSPYATRFVHHAVSHTSLPGFPAPIPRTSRLPSFLFTRSPASPSTNFPPSFPPLSNRLLIISNQAGETVNSVEEDKCCIGVLPTLSGQSPAQQNLPVRCFGEADTLRNRSESTHMRNGRCARPPTTQAVRPYPEGLGPCSSPHLAPQAPNEKRAQNAKEMKARDDSRRRVGGRQARPSRKHDMRGMRGRSG